MLDVASNMSSTMMSNLDDFFTDGDGDDGDDAAVRADGSGKAYTLYGLRARADQIKGDILNEPQEPKSNRAMSKFEAEEAERFALARKEALGIRDEDMHGVNLRPPRPKGGAHSGPLEEPSSPRKVIIESKSVTDQMSDSFKNFSLGSMWESASASTAAARERASSATSAVAELAASAVSEVQTKSMEAARVLQEQTATLRRTASGTTAEPQKFSGYSKKDAGTST
jgi:hypothetical protein